MVVNALRPWISSLDIDKGARWASELSNVLSTCKAGIICLTPASMKSAWLLFETGALSKTVENTYACTLLFDLEPAQVEWPLAQFQHTKPNREDMFKLVTTLNKALGKDSLPDPQLEKSFEKWWPDLEERLRNLPEEKAAAPIKRSVEDMIAELLEMTRNVERQQNWLLRQQLHGKSVAVRLADLIHKDCVLPIDADWTTSYQIVGDILGSPLTDKPADTKQDQGGNEEVKANDHTVRKA